MIRRAVPYLFVLAGLAACGPESDRGCEDDTQCDRNETCDVANGICTLADTNTDATVDPPPSAFTDLLVPFFRGQACLVHEVKSGSKVPVSLSACLHPCMQTSRFEFKHFFSCVGSSCEAYATMWITVSSMPDGCPADAFGRFEESQCVYDDAANVEFGISTTLDSGPISGSMLLEIPFLNNADVAAIAASPDDQALFESRVRQYSQEPGRVPGGRAIELLPSNPEPPATCNGDENCDCFPVGF